jgi:hypothetical protein
LVFFHNHGDPGPGIYLPESWTRNRASFSKRGHTLGDPALASTLEPLPREGLYVVEEAFTCCAKRCRNFEPDELVQLGYNAAAQPILFTPELVEGALALPEVGTRIDIERLSQIRRLKVRETRDLGEPH